jgi:hypothetical protein
MGTAGALKAGRNTTIGAVCRNTLAVALSGASNTSRDSRSTPSLLVRGPHPN